MWLIKSTFVGKKEFYVINMHGTTIKKYPLFFQDFNYT